MDGYTSLIYEYHNYLSLCNECSIHGYSDDKYNECIKSCKKVISMIESKTDLNYQDHDGNTPLMYSCKNQSTVISLLLIKNKANLDIQDDYGDTPIQIAVKLYNKNKVIISLIKNKANLNLKNSEQQNVLYTCLFYNRDIKIQLIFIKSNINLDSIVSYNETILIAALDLNKEITAKILLKHGCSLFHKFSNLYHYTAFNTLLQVLI